MVTFIVLVWLLAFSVRQEDLVKDVTICRDVSILAYRIRHPDDTDDPPDIGLSLDDEATGIEEQIGIAWQITVSHPERSVSPSYLRAELHLHQLMTKLLQQVHQVPQVSLQPVS